MRPITVYVAESLPRVYPTANRYKAVHSYFAICPAAPITTPPRFNNPWLSCENTSVGTAIVLVEVLMVEVVLEVLDSTTDELDDIEVGRVVVVVFLVVEVVCVVGVGVGVGFAFVVVGSGFGVGLGAPEPKFQAP
jgi:hypothetical protein